MTPFSKTTESCECGALEDAADNPNLPVVYDAELNEYHLTYLNGLEGYMLFYHCPVCGGKARESKRESMFARISDDERSRLIELTQNLKTLD